MSTMVASSFPITADAPPAAVFQAIFFSGSSEYQNPATGSTIEIVFRTLETSPFGVFVVTVTSSSRRVRPSLSR